MKQHRRQQPRGFTLIEVIVALTITLMVSASVLLALLAASRELREGQLRQYKSVLVDASTQRVRLSDKATLISNAVAAGTLPSTVSAISTAPWTLDPTAVVAGDLSTGAYFSVLANGQISQLGPATVPPVPANTACSAVPDGVYCREVVAMKGAPVAAPGAILAGAPVATVWIRVSRKGEPASMAVSTQEVVLQ